MFTILYMFLETDVWTPSEIKMFENALLKNDKVFSEISNEVRSIFYFKKNDKKIFH